MSERTEAATTRRIYLASSWRNESYPAVLDALLNAGHEVYDFRDDNGAFNWRDLTPSSGRIFEDWRFEDFREVMAQPCAKEAFANDLAGISWADTGVLLLPCGLSAHMEFGWLAGANKPTAVLQDPMEGAPFHHWRGGSDAELMYGFADLLALNADQVLGWLDVLGNGSSGA